MSKMPSKLMPTPFVKHIMKRNLLSDALWSELPFLMYFMHENDQYLSAVRARKGDRPSARCKVVWLLLIHLSLMPFEITHTDSRGVRLRFFFICRRRCKETRRFAILCCKARELDLNAESGSPPGSDPSAKTKRAEILISSLLARRISLSRIVHRFWQFHNRLKADTLLQGSPQQKFK